MKRTAGGIVVVLLVAALAAVGPAGAAKKRKPPQTRTLSAASNGGLKFDKKTIRAHAGRIKLVMTNPRRSGLPHGVAVRGHKIDKDGDVVDPGKKSTVTVKLKKGTYTFYCPFDGHAPAGMKGKLVVD